jgi:hypothetical protein
MALGGVATGSIKAMEADIVAGIINKRGFRLRAKAVPFIIGNNAAVVAVLDVNSVKKVNRRQIMKTIIKG